MNNIHVQNRSTLKVWGCPRTKNRSQWCHAWCNPTDGLGDCGCLAAHGMLGRTQLAILRFNQKKSAENAP